MERLKETLKLLVLAPFLFTAILVWILVAYVEQGYYYLQGYSWSPIYGGYWHRKTGERR